MINAAAYGMPDPVGDAFFIMSVLFILEKRLIPYAIATTFLLLVREGYALFAAVIFAGTFLKYIDWGKYKRWTPSLLTMLPGAIVVLWMLYVTIQFGKMPILAAQGANLTGPPMFAAWETFVEAIENSNLYEVIWKEVGVFILILTAMLTLRTKQLGGTLRVGLFLYILLMSSLGTTIWFDYSGYMKALGSIIAIIIIVTPFYKSWLLRLFIIFLAFSGVAYNYHFKKGAFYFEFSEPVVIENEVKNTKSLEIFDADMKPIDVPKIFEGYSGIFKPFHRETEVISVRIKNESNETWYALPQGGLYSIHASYHIFDEDGEKLLYDGVRNPIIEAVDPGEEITMDVKISIPPPGKYILKLSMLQEGAAWFYQAGDEGFDIPMTVQ